MAHYALLNENNIVTQVITGRNEDELDNDGNVVNWEDSYSQVTGQRCLRTSYNTFANQHKNGGTPFRGNYAGIGFTYNQALDVFIAPSPFPSWKLNYDTLLWEAPTPMPAPEEGVFWKWFEPNKEWVK